MKKTIFALVFTALTLPAFAALECHNEALEIAKINLDAKAKAYGFSESYINEDSLTRVAKTRETQTLSVGGAIYKGEYEVIMSLDGLCSLEILTINEIGAK
jgi:hypothetical protein